MKSELLLTWTENGWLIRDMMTSKFYVCEREDDEKVFASVRLSGILDKIMQDRFAKNETSEERP